MLSQVAFFVLAVIRKLHRSAFFLYNTVTQRKGAATMENSFAAKHPELVCEWSDKNLPLTPEQIPYGSNKIYWWHGACGHEWTASAKSRHAGEKCPICSGARILVGFNDLATVKPELAAEWSEKNKPLLPTRPSDRPARPRLSVASLRLGTAQRSNHPARKRKPGGGNLSVCNGGHF